MSTTLPLRLFDGEHVFLHKRRSGAFATRTCAAPTIDSGTDVVLVMGVFDGLHVGHRALVSAAVEDARRLVKPCVAVTFNPDPDEVVRGTSPSKRLLSCRDRVAGLLQLGIDAVFVIDFTSQVAGLTPELFMKRILFSEMRPVGVHVGDNYRFGNGASGTVETLDLLGEELGFEVHSHSIVQYGGGLVSATRIRRLLASAELASANELLGRFHYVRGVVEHGRGEGTSFGFPTANIRCDLRDCMPSEGVYACYVTYGSTAWPAAANVGAPPTFAKSRHAFLEANLIDFAGDLYEKPVTVSFVAWLRESRVFDSLTELEQTVLGNIAWVRENLGATALEVQH